jgi:preprotein translocase subunit SecY
MPKWLRALIAAYGAKKLGGGCFSTILIFVVIYFVLGQCNHPVQHARHQPTTQTKTATLFGAR